jgi:hypothetical protein
MNSLKLRVLVTSLLMVAAAVVWSLVIWTALQVSTIVLKTLEQIVDLAGMS